MTDEAQVELVVDGRVLRLWGGARVVALARAGDLEEGDRRWVPSLGEATEWMRGGWNYLGASVDGERLLWRPAPAWRGARVVSPHYTRSVVTWAECDRCGMAIPDYLTFAVGHPTRATFCLEHVPRLVRLRMWWRAGGWGGGKGRGWGVFG